MHNIIISNRVQHQIKQLYKLPILATLILTLIPSSLNTNAEVVQPPFKATKVTAHRGDCSKAPENTIASIKAAIKTNSDYAEIDVQESKDEQVILTHDTNLKRTAGLNKNVWELTRKELQALAVGSYHSKKFKNERIPTLDDVIKAAKNKVKLNIEVKVNGHEKALVRNVVKIIEINGFENQCVITSFDYNILQQIRKLNKKIRLGYLIYKEQRDFSKLDVDFYSIDSSRATPEFINNAHSLKREVHVWTVNSKESIKYAASIGADNIITDRPQLAMKIINSKYKTDKFKYKFSSFFKAGTDHKHKCNKNNSM